MSVKVIAEQVLILLIIMLIGFISRKTGVLKKEANKYFANIMVYVTLPMLILQSFQIDVSKDMMGDAFTVFIVTLGIFVFAILFSTIVYKNMPEKRKAFLSFCTVFSNCAFMGFPVIQSILGAKGVFLGSFYLIHFNIILWTYGMFLYNGKEKNGIKKVLLNSSIIAIVMGIVFLITRYKLPEMINEGVSMLGAMTTPMAMLMIGSVIAGVKLKDIFKGKEIYLAIAVRLILIPGIVLVVLKGFSFSQNVIAVCTLLTAMPIAANTAIFAEKFNGDIVPASKAVAISTVLSIITIPLFTFIILL